MLTSSSFFSPTSGATERMPKPDPVDPYGFSKRLEEKNKAGSRSQPSSSIAPNTDKDEGQSWQSRLNALNKSMSWMNMRQQGQDSGLNFVGGGGAQSLGDGLSSVYPMIYQEGTPGAGGNKITGAIGGAISGASAGSVFGPWGAGIGAALGAAGGLFG